MRVFDTTTFFEEKLMMDLRFNILDPFVDKFIVCEATFSHSGKKKEIKFDKKDFPKFEDKIVHIIINEDPVEKKYNQNDNSNFLRQNSIKRIETQRNYIVKALEDAMEPFKEQKRELRKEYDENGWLTKQEMRLAVKAYRLYKSETDMELLTDYVNKCQRSVGRITGV